MYKFTDYIFGAVIAILFFALLWLFLAVTAPYGSFDSDFKYSKDYPNNQI